MGDVSVQKVPSNSFSWGGGSTSKTSNEEDRSEQKTLLGKEASDILQRKLKLKMHFQIGGGGFTGRDQYKADEVNRAALETVPTIKAGFKLEVPIFGKEEEVFAEKLASEIFVWNFPIHLENENFLLSDENTVLLETGIGTGFKAKLPSVGTLDAFFKYDFKYADRGYRNWQFFSGTNHKTDVGLAFTHDAEGYWPGLPIEAKVFFRAENNWFSWDEKAHGSGFDGQESTFRVGGEVLVPFTSLHDFFLIPDMTISGAGITLGERNVPEEAHPRNMTGGEIEVKLQLNNLKSSKPYVLHGYSGRNLDGYPASSGVYWGLGGTIPGAGDFKAELGRKRHITHFYGEMMPLYGQFSWSPSKEWKDGRLNNLSITIRYDQFEIDGTYHQISALFRVDDPLTTIGIMEKLPELVEETEQAEPKLDKPEPVLVPTSAPAKGCVDTNREKPARSIKACREEALKYCGGLTPDNAAACRTDLFENNYTINKLKSDW